MGEGGPVGQKLAIALAFGSSAAVMVLELVSLRLVAPYIGLTLETNTAVIGVALAAIATGAALGGRFADVVPPTRTLGPAVPVRRGAGDADSPGGALDGRGGPGRRERAGVPRLAVAFFVPASLLAAVTPMVTKLRLHDAGQTGTVVGRLSAYATVGGDRRHCADRVRVRGEGADEHDRALPSAAPGRRRCRTDDLLARCAGGGEAARSRADRHRADPGRAAAV